MFKKSLKSIEPFTSNPEKNSRFCIGCGELATKLVKYDTEGAIIASFVIMIVMVGLMLSTVFGQITDSEFINCIIMETKGTQVVLGTDSDCSTELFTQAVTYYKSIGYNETS